MKAWQEYKIGEIAEVTSSKRIFLSDYVPDGVPFYRSKEIIEKHKGDNVSTKIFISREQFDSIKTRFGAPQKGDILLTSVGTIGTPYLVQENEEFYFKDGNLTWFRKFEPFCDSRFIFYWIQSDKGQGAINSSLIGSSQAALTIDDIKKIKIKLPSLPIQRHIAEVLGRYDALIGNYQRQIGLLKAMAREVYREWFVRGRCPYAQSGALKIASLNEIAEGNIRSITEQDENTVINYVDISSVDTGRINEITPYALKDAPGRARRLIQHGDIVFSTVRPENRSYALILSPINNLVFSTGFAVISPKQPFYSYYVYCRISTDAFIAEMANKAKGSAYPQVGFDDLMDTKIPVPSDDVLIEFHEVADPIFLKAENLKTQLLRLRLMRDKLLPRLMSGQLEVAGQTTPHSGLHLSVQAEI